MKVIPKLQDGGFMSLFTQYTPVQSQAPSQQQQARSSSSNDTGKDDSTKGKLTEKDLFEMISKVDGLPNDMKQLVSNLQNMFEIQQLTGTSDITDLAGTYLSNLYQIKLADFNKKAYDTALKEVTENGGLNEYAITTSGQVIVMDEEDNLKQVSVEELLKQSGKYRPLTNSNLLYLRAYYPEYVNNNKILDTVSNGIGMEQVDKLIRDKLSSLGTSETVRSGYSIKSDSYIMQGLQVLSEAESAAVAGQTGMTLDGMYKNKIITKTQKEQAEAALQYIYNTLPDNARTLLGIKAGQACLREGRRPGRIEEESKKVIMDLIISRQSYTNSSETTWEGTLEQVTKGKGSDGDGSDTGSAMTDPYYNMTRAWGGEDTSITINKGTRYQLDVNGVLYSSVPDKDGNPIGRTSLLDALQSGLQGMVIDPSAITFGNVSLTTDDFANIMFDGAGGGSLVALPIKNGTKAVNIEILDQWEQANKDFEKHGINIMDEQSVAEHIQEITQILYSHNLEGLVDVTGGGIDYSQLGQFLIVDGYAVAKSGDNRFDTEYTKYLSRLDNSTVKMLEQALSTNDKKNDYSLDVGGIPWNNDNIYKGSIYIPITSNQLKGITASGNRIKEGPAMVKEYEHQMLQKRLQAKEPKLGFL